MKFKFTVKGKVFHADMADNDIVREIAKRLPLTATYTRYTEHEYYTRLPFPANDKNCKKERFARKNEVWYFGGWNAFTILFGDCDTSPFDVVKLGELQEDVVPVLSPAEQRLEIVWEIDE